MEEDILSNTGPTMDATAHVDISIDDNEGYSETLLKDVEETYNPDELDQLIKEEKIDDMRVKGKQQILKLWETSESLKTHGDKFEVIILVKEGIILRKIRSTFDKRSDFTQWRKRNFAHRHLRTMQQAEQLADIEDFAIEYASLGKNRVLELHRLKKDTEMELDEIFEKHPFPDTTADMEGQLFKEHCDSIVTFYRLKTAGIEDVTFEDASLMAAIKKVALKKEDAEALKKRMQKEENKEVFFENYLMNLMVLPGDSRQGTSRTETVDSLLVSFLEGCTEEKIQDEEWVLKHRDPATRKRVVQAYHRIVALAEKLDIDLNSLTINDSNIEKGD